MSAINKLERQCLTLAEEVDTLRASEDKLRKALRNCLLFAMQQSRRQNTGGWENILRFCKEAGIEPSPLRDADEVSDGR